MQIKFLNPVTAYKILDFDPDTMDTVVETNEFQKDEFVDIRDVYWDYDGKSCVEFPDGKVSILDNEQIEVIGQPENPINGEDVSENQTYELTEKDILPFVPVDIHTDDGIKTINLDF